MKKQRKYNNTICEYDGHLFDSQREKDRYIYLKDAHDKGIISELELQPKFELIPKITENVVKHLKTKDKIIERVVQRPITYTADFAYIKDGIKIIEDVKICKAVIPKEFSLKIKMMRYFHNINVKLIFNPTEKI